MAEGLPRDQVTATAHGPWPGSDPLEAIRIVRGELGTPHLPFLPEFPDRGVGSDAVGRTACLLEELAIDVQPHGWRLVDKPGRDMQRARSALATDLNVLADVAGEEERPAEAFKVRLLGPLSLTAALYLHNGERALSDHGARRDIVQSLTAGIKDHLKRVSVAVPGAALAVQLDEPDIADVLAGTIPTASGYRTLRSVPGEEVTLAWRAVIDAARDAGAAETVISVPEVEAPFQRILASGADGIAVPIKALTTRQWEQLAGAVEGGKRLWLGALPTADRVAALPRTADVVDAVWRPWRQLGLPPSQLGAVRVTPSHGLVDFGPSEAKDILVRLTKVADGLNQAALG
ncbi:hypothetical protein [Arthrobacter sp. M4]|uniref:hypothetical protein n=1 Tax=Arthrobacter sp. M4 TaxID=218160 RepID=UPI001CDD16F3|nr:hypothetical protein [Arthrobacter sp. M4]MCA4132292.1 hypothetical protein [Arthrobacter sp. M4]